MITNVVLNPSAEGATASLAAGTSSAVTMVADAVTGAGAKSYRVAASAATLSSASVRAAERLAVAPGQRAWGRIRCRLDASVIGARKLSAKLVFRNSAGAIIDHAQPVIGSSEGVSNRWYGTPHASRSEQITAGVTRVNMIDDPGPVTVSWNGEGSAGGTITRTIEPAPGTPSGLAMRATWNTAASGGYNFNKTIGAIAPGAQVTVSTLARASLPGSIARIAVIVFNAQGVGVTAFYPPQNTTLVEGSFTTVATTFVMPPTAVTAGIYFDYGGGPSQFKVGDWIELSSTLAEVAPTVQPWFSGSSATAAKGYNDQVTTDLVPDGVFYRWAGGADASVSERYEKTERRLNLSRSARTADVNRASMNYGTSGAGSFTITSRPDMPSGSAFSVAWTTAPTSGWNINVQAAAMEGIAPGRTYTVSMYGIHSWAGAETQLTVEFTDASGASLGYIGRGVQIIPAGALTRLSGQFTAPAGASRANVFWDAGAGVRPPTGATAQVSSLLIEETLQLRDWFSGSSVSAGTGNTQQVVDLIVGGDAPTGAATADLLVYRDPMYQAAATDVLIADSVLLAAATVGTTSTPPPYFDGSTPRYAAWTGTANASTSIYYETAPVVSALTDDAPGPRVLLNFVDFLPGTATATIHRLTDAADTIVPGADRAAALGGLIRTDYYAPFRSTARYLAEMFNGAGVSLGYTEASSAYLDVGETYIASPIDPRQQVRVILDASAGSELENPVQASLHQVNGRRILIAEADYGLSRLPMPFWTDTIDQYRQALAVFRSANSMVVVRTPPPMEVPRVLYCFGVPRRSETNLPMGIEEFYWEWTVEEVTPPTTQVIAAQITYARFRSYYPTYGAFKAAYATYRAAQLAPPPEV